VDFERRSLTPADEALLRDYLYLAVFVPPGEPPLPRGIVELPEIARYVDGWGRDGDQGVLALDRDNGRDLGAAWLRLWTKGDTGYGFVDYKTPELSMAVRPD